MLILRSTELSNAVAPKAPTWRASCWCLTTDSLPRRLHSLSDALSLLLSCLICPSLGTILTSFSYQTRQLLVFDHRYSATGVPGHLFELQRMLELDDERRDSRFILVRALDRDRVIALRPVGVSLCVGLIVLYCLLYRV
jgi:hypothetical protein